MLIPKISSRIRFFSIARTVSRMPPHTHTRARVWAERHVIIITIIITIIVKFAVNVVFKRRVLAVMFAYRVCPPVTIDFKAHGPLLRHDNGNQPSALIRRPIALIMYRLFPVARSAAARDPLLLFVAIYSDAHRYYARAYAHVTCVT